MAGNLERFADLLQSSIDRQQEEIDEEERRKKREEEEEAAALEESNRPKRPSVATDGTAIKAIGGHPLQDLWKFFFG